MSSVMICLLKQGYIVIGLLKFDWIDIINFGIINL